MEETVVKRYGNDGVRGLEYDISELLTYDEPIPLLNNLLNRVKIESIITSYPIGNSRKERRILRRASKKYGAMVDTVLYVQILGDDHTIYFSGDKMVGIVSGDRIKE